MKNKFAGKRNEPPKSVTRLDIQWSKEKRWELESSANLKTRQAENHRAERLRVLIAENSPGTRRNLSELCASLPRLEVVGEAVNGLDAIEAVRILKPDVLTLDMNMPRLNGIDVLRKMQREKHGCVVIVFTSLADEFYKEKCLELNATHFFNKITEFDQFLELLKSM